MKVRIVASITLPRGEQCPQKLATHLRRFDGTSSFALIADHLPAQDRIYYSFRFYFRRWVGYPNHHFQVMQTDQKGAFFGLRFKMNTVISKCYLVLLRISQRDLKKWTYPSSQNSVAEWVHLHKDVVRNGRVFKQEMIFVDRDHRILKGKVAIDDPVIAEFFLIKAADINQAAGIGQTCPILNKEGEIEIREILA